MCAGICIIRCLQTVRTRAKNGETPGYPRFQGKNRYDSFTYPQSGFKVLDDGKLKLSRIGTIRMLVHRAIVGKIKTCTILARR